MVCIGGASEGGGVRVGCGPGVCLRFSLAVSLIHNRFKLAVHVVAVLLSTGSFLLAVAQIVIVALCSTK